MRKYKKVLLAFCGVGSVNWCVNSGFDFAVFFIFFSGLIIHLCVFILIRWEIDFLDVELMGQGNFG